LLTHFIINLVIFEAPLSFFWDRKWWISYLY